MEEVFSGSHKDLEHAAQQLYLSRHRIQHLGLEVSVKTHQIIPPTLSTARQQKIKKSLGSQLNFKLQQQMGVFQASKMKTLNWLSPNCL